MYKKHYPRSFGGNRKAGNPKSRPLWQFPIFMRLLAVEKILIFSLIISVVLGSAGASWAFAQQASQTDPEILRKLKAASTEHELILLLIESKSYDRIESEWKKVLDLKLSSKYEGAVAQSLLTIAYKLSEAKQFPIAQAILDASLAGVNFSNKNKADILRFKAYLFKEAGDLEAAIETYRLASELVEKP